MMAASTAAAMDKDSVVSTFPNDCCLSAPRQQQHVSFHPNQRRRLTIPELLESRQQTIVGSSYQQRQQQQQLLSSAVAWNRGRMQNMILAVGPGTPAAAAQQEWANAANNDNDSHSSSSSSSDAMEMDEDHHHHDNVAEEEDEQEQDHRRPHPKDESHHDNDDDSDDDEMAQGDDDSEGNNATNGADSNAARPAGVFERSLYLGNDSSSADLVELMVMDYLEANAAASARHYVHDNDADQDADDDGDDSSAMMSVLSQDESVDVAGAGRFVSAIRHGGCINTAVWLTSPWRLSVPSMLSHNASSASGNSSTATVAVDTEDCPTQLLTSGDDRTVKFWDVRYAMGSANPLPGGQYSKCPFADLSECQPYDWKEHHDHRPLAGSVIPLASLSTGHRGNVFHVTPVDGHPGKVVTCAADGYLRMSDVHRPDDSSTVIVSPDGADSGLDDFMPMGLFRRTAMCFSHHLINANTGLLCGERGLKRFDLRLPPREQSSRSLLGNRQPCKSCAIWSASSSSSDDSDSAYVFAGGASSEVFLYDLRMTDDSSSRIVQKYRPSGLSATSDVSVSGLDVSRDKRELLVSYENDQIFTFPVFPHVSCGRPSVDELSDYCSLYGGNDDDGPVLSELATYGGHLNRFTFLKNAKYAGPQDEYICTGSDSGRAWIYDRATGTVAAFLAADHSTCNGVIPHPSLPFFITYGIDSTAKVWRATNPVDRDADDSPLGRAKRYHQSQYEKGSLVRNWAYVKATAASIATVDEDVSESITVFPDQLAVGNDTNAMGNSILGSILLRRRVYGMRGTRSSGIYNDFRKLPDILQNNLFSCVIAEEEGESEPVSSGLSDLGRRMSTIRLRFQADQRGLVWNPNVPWVLKSRPFYNGKDSREKKPRSKRIDCSKLTSTEYGNQFDLIPDSPSDWIPYDPDMTRSPRAFGPRFNVEDYREFYEERYSALDPSYTYSNESNPTEVAWIQKGAGSDSMSSEAHEGTGGQEPDSGVPYNSERALTFLHDTALMIKEGGNAALQAGHVMEALRRYDCAIKYCSVAFMLHPNANPDFLSETDKKWCPLRKVMVTTRLNLCMLLTDSDLRGAKEQASLALKELAPFCMKPGRVMGGKKLSLVHNDNEPLSTFHECKELQAKAHFRQGSVFMKIGDYEEAVSELEKSITCTKELAKEPDRFVLRRLAEAKHEKSTKTKRQQKKIRRMLARDSTVLDNEKGGNDDKDGDSSSAAYAAMS